jgi:uncharacterized repeat protein (TIGR01451 family)
MSTINLTYKFLSLITLLSLFTSLVQSNQQVDVRAYNPPVSTCNTNVLTNPSFEQPIATTLNGNNILTGAGSLPGWASFTGANAFNIIKVNGSAYVDGADNAHDGSQYLDIAGVSDYPVQSFTLTSNSKVTYSAWFSNRDEGFTAYVPWVGKVDILNSSNAVVASSDIATNPNFTANNVPSQELWFKASGTSATLPPGTYKYRAFVGDYGHVDDTFLCITPDSADLKISQTVSTTTPNFGDSVTFTLTAANLGPNDASGAVATDILPSGYTYVSSTASTGTYTSGTGIWNIGNIANAATATLTIQATVNPTGVYNNPSSITGNEFELVTSNNVANTLLTPGRADLQVTSTVSNSTPAVDDEITFTLVAKNNGPLNASQVIVNDLLPSGYTFVSSTPSIGTYDPATGNWTIGTLNNQISQTLVIKAKVKASGIYLNSTTIRANEQDAIAGNNSASTSVNPIAITTTTTPTSTNLIRTGGENIKQNITYIAVSIFALCLTILAFIRIRKNS